MTDSPKMKIDAATTALFIAVENLANVYSAGTYFDKDAVSIAVIKVIVAWNKLKVPRSAPISPAASEANSDESASANTLKKLSPTAKAALDEVRLRLGVCH